MGIDLNELEYLRLKSNTIEQNQRQLARPYNYNNYNQIIETNIKKINSVIKIIKLNIFCSLFNTEFVSLRDALNGIDCSNTFMQLAIMDYLCSIEFIKDESTESFNDVKWSKGVKMNNFVKVK